MVDVYCTYAKTLNLVRPLCPLDTRSPTAPDNHRGRVLVFGAVTWTRVVHKTERNTTRDTYLPEILHYKKTLDLLLKELWQNRNFRTKWLSSQVMWTVVITTAASNATATDLNSIFVYMYIAHTYNLTCSKEYLYIRSPAYKYYILYVRRGILSMSLNLHKRTTCA